MQGDLSAFPSWATSQTQIGSIHISALFSHCAPMRKQKHWTCHLKDKSIHPLDRNCQILVLYDPQYLMK